MNFKKIIMLHEFFPYFCIGGIVTLLDWSLFWATTNMLGFHYQVALISSYTIAAMTHYTANKLITFRCHSKQIGSQLSVYALVTGSSLLLSMGIMALFISSFALNPFLARVLTTVCMLPSNFLLHKYITFSKKIFIQRAT